jgi:hypothetical protein
MKMSIDLTDERYEGMLVADGLDEAIIGTTTVWGQDRSVEVFVYSVDKVLDVLMTRDEMEYDDAREFFDFNIAGAYMGQNTPIWMESVEVEE